MRKIYVSADMEGICGIADWKETELESPQSAYFKLQMAREVAAACEAAAEAGAEEILVKDAHDSGRGIDPSLLPERVRLMRAWTNDPYSMMAGIDAGFGGAMMIGYHSAAGSDGNPLAHTLSTANAGVFVNGAAASEFLINAYTASSFGVPVLLLTGDLALCESAKELNPCMRTVAVSEGVGAASVSIHPSLALRRIKEAAAEALRADPASCLLPLPSAFAIRVLFRQHGAAHRGSFYPGAEKLGPYEVGFAAREWLDVLRFLYFVL